MCGGVACGRQKRGLDVLVGAWGGAKVAWGPTVEIPFNFKDLSSGSGHNSADLDWVKPCLDTIDVLVILMTDALSYSMTEPLTAEFSSRLLDR